MKFTRLISVAALVVLPFAYGQGGGQAGGGPILLASSGPVLPAAPGLPVFPGCGIQWMSLALGGPIQPSLPNSFLPTVTQGGPIQPSLLVPPPPGG